MRGNPVQPLSTHQIFFRDTETVTQTYDAAEAVLALHSFHAETCAARCGQASATSESLPSASDQYHRHRQCQFRCVRLTAADSFYTDHRQRSRAALL